MRPSGASSEWEKRHGVPPPSRPLSPLTTVAVIVRILSRQNADVRGRADRVLAVGRGKAQRVGGEGTKVRRQGLRVSGATQPVGVTLVGQDHQNIGVDDVGHGQKLIQMLFDFIKRESIGIVKEGADWRHHRPVQKRIGGALHPAIEPRAQIA